MLFAIHCTDRPDSLSLRMATRDSHLQYLAASVDKLVQAGPLLDAEGTPCGSLLIVDVADRTEAERLSAGDPYVLAGLFESVRIHGHRTVFRDGAPVE